jgi:hypothetical protein
LTKNINEPGAVADECIVILIPEPPSLRSVRGAAGDVRRSPPPGAGAESASIDEERREILASVLVALAANPPDPDEMAACSHLLKHLSETAGHRTNQSA